MISQKSVQMLTCLCNYAEENRCVRVEDLAARFHVSVRTVRYDLDKIDYYLKANGYPKLERVKGLGVRLKVPRETIEGIRGTLSGMQVDAYVLSKSERALCIQMMLFDASEPITYEAIADKLYVSRKTAIEDVRAIKEAEGQRGVHIGAAKHGIYYSGPESQLRIAILNRILAAFSPIELWELGFGIYLNRSVVIEKQWHAILNNTKARALEELLLRVEEEQGTVLTDNQFYLMALLTALSHNRMELGHCVDPSEVSPVEIPPILTLLFSRLPGALGWELPEAEQYCIAHELETLLNHSFSKQAEQMAEIITSTLLSRVSEAMNHKYYLDNTLRAGLQEHLAATIRDSGKRKNDDEGILQTIVARNEALYGRVWDCLAGLSYLPFADRLDMESALITLHFCASDERRALPGGRIFKALVVCSNGIGTSKIVSATAVKHFPQIRIAATTSVHNVQSLIDQNRPDFILTTVPLSCRNIPVIQVNPIMTEDDIDRIHSFFLANRRSNEADRNELLQELSQLVSETCEIQDRDTLEAGFRQILGMETRPRPAALLPLLKEEGVLVGVEANGWEDAIRQSAQPLVRAGYFEPRYVDAMIENVRSMGPYIVILPGVALPHSVPEDGVRASCMGFTVLKEPVRFGKTANDPVRILLCLGSRDGQEHMQEMSGLINLLGDEAVVERFCAARDRQEVLRMLRALLSREGEGAI